MKLYASSESTGCSQRPLAGLLTEERGGKNIITLTKSRLFGLMLFYIFGDSSPLAT